ncbi:NADH dehydrogenase I subunit N [Legionella beliardensis]|uniref:NADH-quinone oxidoreductase subunit N n=1 Tax=Legionella beliardensis TaxID=91822 RepID=A0A378I4D7_9GAMM|nr:NADH-quinone oxidoreductase subunit NuoN [Legionella beliardensis]STX30077.1 NADH dehydrogenase I subunit N [Legionella beliardensis]
MIPLLDNLSFALPEIILLVTLTIALLADLFFRHHYKNITLSISLIGLALAGLTSFMLLGNFKVLILNGLFISDDIAQLMKIFITLSAFICFAYSSEYIDERQMPSGDYYILGLSSTLGMMILVSAHSLLTIYLGLELLSLPLYAMTAIRRTNSDAAEAALKYFIMGAIASGMLLYGFSLLYGATGKLDLTDMANAIAVNWDKQNMLISFALVFVLVGVGFKLAAVPFHMWAPDVYQGAPSSVTLFISSAPKIAALGMALRLLTIGLIKFAPQWQQLLLAMTLLSTAIGNFVAVNQTNIKRLLAYSAVAHVGYALFGILAGSAAGYAAATYYILVYSLMTVAAFGFIVLLSRNGYEIEEVNDLRGLNKRNPWLAFMMLIVMFSMAGVPPTVGFFTKLLVLKALIDVGMTWVAVLGLIFAVVGAYYYIRIVKIMYFDDAAEFSEVTLPMSSTLLYSANCLSLLFLGIFPSGLINACVNAFTS